MADVGFTSSKGDWSGPWGITSSVSMLLGREGLSSLSEGIWMGIPGAPSHGASWENAIEIGVASMARGVKPAAITDSFSSSCSCTVSSSPSEDDESVSFGSGVGVISLGVGLRDGELPVEANSVGGRDRRRRTCEACKPVSGFP